LPYSRQEFFKGIQQKNCIQSRLTVNKKVSIVDPFCPFYLRIYNS